MFDNDEQIFVPVSLAEEEKKIAAKIFDGLNPQQAAAVDCLEGPLLIMAGAGSGKTRVLTCRMANLLAHGVSPRKILAITFTNKAAQEMKDRAEKMIGSAAQDVWISTFHSFCARVLRREIAVTKKYQSNYVIYDSSDSQALIRECVRELGLDSARFSSVMSRISDAKNNLLDAAHYRQSISAYRRPNEYEMNISNIYFLYEKKLRENNALDFDDLIFLMVKIFQEHEDIRQKYQNWFHYILVDEYQDTNMAQYMLTKYLAEKHKNICVVGDADQSIYGWRGADMRNILHFEDDYPTAKIITLEQNYRSTKQILGAANSVIQQNINRMKKNLWTENETGDKVRFTHCLTDRTEATFVAREIRKLVSHENFQYREIAILYRTNAQSRVLEEKFNQSEIPYTIIGGLKFYERKEIKDIIAYLRLIFNPRDNISLQRIINVPKRGLGAASLGRLAEFSNETGFSIFEIIINDDLLRNVPQLSPKIKNVLRNFASMIMSFSESQKNFTLHELINAVLDESGYLKALQTDEEKNKPENISRVENLSSFVNSAQEFSAMRAGVTLEDFLNHVALMTDADSLKDEDSKVSLMTVHSAKGLEFPVIFLTGMEEGLFPHANSMVDDARLEEERRACYVAITRAKKFLYITAARDRKTFGNNHSSSISRFIKEIPTDFMANFSEQRSEETARNNSFAYSHRNAYSPPPPKIDKPSRELQKKAQPKIDWRLGDQVRHRKWGLGTVVAVQKDTIKIIFANPEIGEKILKSAVAPIEKI